MTHTGWSKIKNDRIWCYKSPQLYAKLCKFSLKCLMPGSCLGHVYNYNPGSKNWEAQTRTLRIFGIFRTLQQAKKAVEKQLRKEAQGYKDAI